MIKKLFKRSEKTSREAAPEKKISWQPLQTIDELNTLVEKSKDKLQIIFKHSSRCGISSMVLRRFNSENITLNESADFHFVDIFSSREMSNEIAHRFQIIHQSPQLLLVSKKQIVHHSSHSDINSCDLSEYTF